MFGSLKLADQAIFWQHNTLTAQHDLYLLVDTHDG